MKKCLDCEKKLHKDNKSGWCNVCKNKHIKTTGYKHPVAYLKKMSESRMGENNPNWIGDKVGYFGLHHWVKRRMPKPLICPKCGKRPTLDLANKGIYDRNLDNWEWLCRKCHMDGDGRNKLLHTKEIRAKALKTLKERGNENGKNCGMENCKTSY